MPERLELDGRTAATSQSAKVKPSERTGIFAGSGLWGWRRWAVSVVVISCAALVSAGVVPAAASATTYSRNVAYVFDDSQFPCGDNGCGMNDTSGPGQGASIFVNAVDGTAPGIGGTGSYTPANGELSAVNLTNVPFSELSATPDALSGFDTAIVYEPCNIGLSENSNVLGALNAFVDAGGKVMMFDADACADNADGQADWSGFVFPFATNSPGPEGAVGSYESIQPSSLTTGLSLGEQDGDSVGDANVFTTYDGHWFSSIIATNANITGIVQAYATTPSGGLAIYDGEDFWYTDYTSAHLQLVFDNMLAQPWSPSNLPNTTSASGITLSPSSQTAFTDSTASVTATVADTLGEPQAAVAVTLTVTSGPDAGRSLSGSTASDGTYVFKVKNGGDAGTDSATASFLDSTGQTHTSNSVTVQWTPSRSLSWLAAGDSYSSGEGLPHATGPCVQARPGSGSEAWAFVARSDLGNSVPAVASPTLTACTGATTSRFFSSEKISYHLRHITLSAEWQPSMGTFDLVSFTFGGNDVRFADVIKKCLRPTLHNKCPKESALRAQIAAFGRGYGSFLTNVAKRAVVPDGNILVLGYPELIEKPSLWSKKARLLGCGHFTVAEANELRGLAGDLNATIGADVRAANRQTPNGVHFTFVDVNSGGSAGISRGDPDLFEPSKGPRHEICSSQPWLTAIDPARPLSGSYHPKQAGQNAMGALAAAVISRLQWSGLKVG